MANDRSAVEHWAKIHEQYDAAIRFVEWMNNKYGIELDYTFCDEDNPAPLELKKLADQFFEVDQKKLELERRAILESMAP